MTCSRAALALMCMLVGSGETLANDRIRISFQGRDRRYVVHVPAGIGRARPVPLVLVFHGGSDTPENMESISGFSLVADREGFIVAYPEAVEKNWADGRDSTVADKTGIDDVGFTRAVVADIGRRYAIDMRRVYATGPSNGGIFSNRLGCEAADLFAAIGPVIGTIASNLSPRCRPSAAISVVGIQGVADPLMPFAGGEEGGEAHLGRGGRIAGSRATQELWRTLDGCNPEATVTTLPLRESDGTSVLRLAYSGCKDGTEVVWYEIIGGGHRWPPRQLDRPLAEAIARRAFGVSSQNMDATETLWAFFSAHAKR